MLKIPAKIQKRALDQGIELVAFDEHVEARINGSVFTGGSAEAALGEALASLTEGGSAQQHETRPMDRPAGDDNGDDNGEADEDEDGDEGQEAEDDLAERQEEDHQIEKEESLEQTPEQLEAFQPAKKRKAKAKKVAKPPRQKEKKVKAPKKAKRQREDGDEDDEGEEDDGESRSVVKHKYRKRYQPTDNTCGDAMAEAFKAAIQGEDGKVDPKALAKVGKDNGVDVKRWAGKNVGMVRMNLGNVLRGMLRNGHAVSIAGQSFQPEGEKKSKKKAKKA